MAQNNVNASASGEHRAGTVFGILLTVLLVPILLFNAAVMVQSVRHQVPPKMFGHYVIVMPDGDLGFFQESDPHYYNAQDTVAFMDRNGAVSSGQVLALIREGTEISGIQLSGGQGATLYDVTPDETYGKLHFRIPFAGRIILLLDNDIGALIAIGLPLIGALLYDIRRRKAMAALRQTDDAEGPEPVAEKAAEPAAAELEPEPVPAVEPVPEVEPEPAAEPEEHTLMNLFQRELERTKEVPEETPAEAEEEVPEEAPSEVPEDPDFSDRGFVAGRALKEPTPEPEAAAEAEPVVEVEPVVEIEPELAVKPEPVSKPAVKVKPVVKPAVKPKTAAKPKAAVKVKPVKVAGRKEREK